MAEELKMNSWLVISLGFLGGGVLLFRDRRLNIAIRHAGLVRKFYLTGLAMRMGRYDSAVAEKMERIERDMLSLRDFLPPYASCSRVMMKRWLQNKKHRLSHIFKK